MKPAGGSKSKVPVVKFTFETVPPAGLVALMLPAVTVKGVDTQGGCPKPVSLGSVTFRLGFTRLALCRESRRRNYHRLIVNGIDCDREGLVG